MAKKYTELPGWIFVGDEVSSGVYKFRGKDEYGRSDYAAKIIADQKKIIVPGNGGSA